MQVKKGGIVPGHTNFGSGGVGGALFSKHLLPPFKRPHGQIFESHRFVGVVLSLYNVHFLCFCLCHQKTKRQIDVWLISGFSIFQPTGVSFALFARFLGRSILVIVVLQIPSCVFIAVG